MGTPRVVQPIEHSQNIADSAVVLMHVSDFGVQSVKTLQCIGRSVPRALIHIPLKAATLEQQPRLNTFPSCTLRPRTLMGTTLADEHPVPNELTGRHAC